MLSAEYLHHTGVLEQDALWRLLDELFDTFRGVYVQRFQKRYYSGIFRAARLRGALRAPRRG